MHMVCSFQLYLLVLTSRLGFANFCGAIDVQAFLSLIFYCVNILNKFAYILGFLNRSSLRFNPDLLLETSSTDC